MTGMAAQLGTEISTLAEGVRAGMVRITNGPRGSGAGCLLHSDGLVLTNAHVARSRRLTISLEDGRSFPAHFLGSNRSSDLAALSIDATDLPSIELGDSTRLRPGELVFSLGFPWGVDGGLTYGIVIGQGPWPIEAPGSKTELLAASLHLRPGHSGGPMLNARGQLVGLNTIMQGADVGVAVPIDRAKRFLRETIGEVLDRAA